jgi:MFS family permease
MALSQGLLAHLVAEAAPASLRGSAFGVFNLLSGLALLVASALAGWLWQRLGPPATFLAGAGFAGVVLAALVAPRPRRAA